IRSPLARFSSVCPVNAMIGSSGVVDCISSSIRTHGRTVYDPQTLIHAQSSTTVDDRLSSVHTGGMEPLDPFPPSDPVGEALHFLRMNGAFYCRSELTAPWGLTLPAMPGYIWFHVATSGRLWLETGDEEEASWIQ